MTLATRLTIVTFLAASALATGCAEPADAGDFVSDNPASGGGDGGETTDGGSDPDGDGAGGTDGGEDPGDDGEREIAEADIVQIEGDRLYALSRFSGLAVIDVSTRDELPVLGRYRAQAQPFEMYVAGGQVFVMFSDFGVYEWDDELQSYTWHQTSKLMALDATDPANIRVRGEFDLPGQIQDSRRVGDILYLVTYENGSCWNCQPAANTTITSLDVSDEANPKRVDQLVFTDEADDIGWGGQRSVSSTTERMYVAGSEWRESGDVESSIDVVDISDPDGDLAPGTNVPVAGQITSRWQMDEFEGVLRVVSQPGFWGSSNPPVIETFTVTSAHEVTALGSTSMVLPRPESLRSVRFDGTRGYAITFEQTDPLFTLDLSDPATPRQVGELEIPGWVYHMEPRGDQIIALGFDQNHPDGSVNVSLFDVSVFDQPTMLDRVHFGGDWATFGEDQNRIHKAFNILDELGLILVPYSGWDYDDDDEWGCYGTYKGGIQLIDMAGRELLLRGVADSRGRPRRALLHDDRLLSVSDKAVESFDITNRDAPTKTADLTLATNVNRVVKAGGRLIRLSLDWWSNETTLEVASAADPENPEALGRLSLAELSKGGNEYECWDYGLYGADIFAQDGHVYLVHEVYTYGAQYEESTRMDVFDVRDPLNLRHVRSMELPFARGYEVVNPGGLDVGADRTVQIGPYLVMSRSSTNYDATLPVANGSFEVIDLTDPANPAHVGTLSRPPALQYGGLQVHEGQVVSWHMRKENPSGTKVRFYLDRLDLDDPTDPSARAPVNVPGVVVAYRESSGRVVTVDFQLERKNMPEDACWGEPKIYGYQYETGECILLHRDLNLTQLQGTRAVWLDNLDIEGDEGSLRAVIASDDRVFVHVQVGGGGGYVDDGHGGYVPPSQEIVTLSDLTETKLTEASRLELGMTWLWLHGAGAHETRLVFPHQEGLAVIDAHDARNPELTVHPVYGYGCQDLSLADGTAYCALGEFGVQAVDL